jgi:rhamnosyl/mannosyltransferase
LKILHIGKYYWPSPGGIETAVRDIAAEQVRQGFSVWVLSHWDRPGKNIVQEVCEGVCVTRMPILGHVAYAPITPLFPKIFQRIVSQQAPDIIHVHMPNLSPLWMVLFRRKAPIVVHWHSDVFTSLKSLPLTLLYPGYALFQNLLLQKASAVVATSNSYQKASRPLQTFQDKTVIIPLALDPARMTKVDHVTKMHDSFDSRRLVLSAGRFTYYKGFDVLVQAAIHLREDVQVIIAGDGPLRPKIQELIIKMKLEDRVFLPGRLSDQELHALMAQCSVFCLPSIDRTEAFGMVLMEAMHYGRPIVSTRVWGSGMQLVNEHGVTGFCVEPENDRDLANALEFLLDHPREAQAMGEAGKKRVDSMFHIASQVRQFNELYTRLHAF